MRTICFILGTGHCGSTLLDLILGSHSEGMSLGEVYCMAKRNPPKVACTICGFPCCFWTERMKTKVKHLYRTSNLMGSRFQGLGIVPPPSTKFYNLLFNKAKRRLLIDSSKKVAWINQHYKELKKNFKIRTALIYLSRDGRAVINAYFRKYPELGLEHHAYAWNRKIDKINRLYQSWPENQRMHIHYEDLATYPAETLQQATNFLQLPFETEMMEFWKHEHHLVKGNTGTRFFLLRYNQPSQSSFGNTFMSNYYANHEFGIKLDERWKKELSATQLDVIDRIIGEKNASILSSDL